MELNKGKGKICKCNTYYHIDYFCDYIADSSSPLIKAYEDINLSKSLKEYSELGKATTKFFQLPET